MLAFFARPAAALEGDWVAADFLQARLLVEEYHPDFANFTLAGGLEVRLDENWHAYWRTPGDAGLAPGFDWQNSENITVQDLAWPAPRRFREDEFYTFGYENQMIFPLALRIEDRTKPAILALDLTMLVCADICVPQAVSLSLDIPALYSPAGQRNDLLVKARKSLPEKADTPALKISSVVVGPDALVVNAFSQTGFTQADLFVEADGLYMTAPPEITPDADDPRKAMLLIAAPEGAGNLAEAVSGKTLTLTLVDGDRAVEKNVDF